MSTIHRIPRAIPRARQRRRQRGATVFVVVLVIAMLTGIGLFAAQAGSIATSTSGATRVKTQSRYLAESAMTTVMAKLSRDLQAHVDFMARQNSKDCLGQQSDPFYPQCSRFGRTYLEEQLGVKLYEGYDQAKGTHGTLGRAAGDADLLVELSDLHRLDRPVPGFDATSAGAVDVHFMSLMLHGTGRIRLAPPAGNTKTTLSATTFRAELVIGPLTGP